MFSGATLGTLVGAIPAVGGDIGSVVAWEQARRTSPDKEQFGKGSIRGVSTSCSACNAAIGGAMTTMLTLGIPGDAVSAILIGALLIHGIQPGPLLFSNHQSFVFSIVFLLVFAAFLIMLIGLVGAKPLAKILTIPGPWLWTGIIMFGTIGAYALNNTIVAVWLMYAAGIVGFLFRQANIPLGPLGTWLDSWSHDGSQPAARPDPESRRLDEHPHTPDCAVLPVGNTFHTLVATFAEKSAHTVTSSHFQVTIEV